MSLLDIIPGGSYLQSAIDSTTKKIGFETAIIKGKIGKVYYGTQVAITDAVTSTAKTAQAVTSGIRNYALYAFLAIGLVLLWPFIAPLLANAFSSVIKKAAA